MNNINCINYYSINDYNKLKIKLNLAIMTDFNLNIRRLIKHID